MTITNQNYNHEEITSRIQRMLVTIQFRIFGLPNYQKILRLKYTEL